MAMQKAKDLSDFYKVFYPDSLKEEDMEEFYCGDTMRYRTGNEIKSPINEIYKIMKSDLGKNAVLLLGHRGCGKSTELMKLKSDLIDEKYRVESIDCKLEMDLLNAEYWDFFILITQKLIEIAKKLECEIDKTIIRRAVSYWDNKSITEAFTEAAGYGIESELSAGVGLKGLLGMFMKISGHITNNSETRTEIRKQVKNKSDEWIAIITSITTTIQSKSNGKKPILIFEEIDKMDPKLAMDIFYNNASSFSQLPFKAIYTFPINLFYSEKFTTLKGYFEHKVLPMIKVHNKDMSENTDGINIIKNIVYKRADEHFFEDGVLDKMIKKTGGALRDLFEVIRNAGSMSDDRKMDKICEKDANYALMELKSDLTRLIEVRNYDFLKDVYNKKQQIPDSDMLLKFMEALVILEYNGERWHDLHPLIYDFLNDQGWFDE